MTFPCFAFHSYLSSLLCNLQSSNPMHFILFSFLFFSFPCLDAVSHCAVCITTLSLTLSACFCIYMTFLLTHPEAASPSPSLAEYSQLEGRAASMISVALADARGAGQRRCLLIPNETLTGPDCIFQTRLLCADSSRQMIGISTVRH
jgi:hypothetical protein